MMPESGIVSGHGSSYETQLPRFIGALIRTGRMVDAAREVGIHPNTATRWASRPEVRQALQEARNAALTEAIHELSRSAELAVGTLVSLCTDPDAPPSARIAAARAILEHALRRY